jgi:predicted N-acyltransferase
VNYRTRIVSSLAEIGQVAWDALLAKQSGSNPFLSYAFLHAMHESGSASEDSGWVPQYLTLWREDQLVGALPLYLKYHSYGEYVFDWAWADAYRRHGLQYYPKLLSAIPFTPVSGPRLLAQDEDVLDTLILLLKTMQSTDGEVSSTHILYPPQEQAEALRKAGFMLRSGVQFHWTNNNYANFDEFLAILEQKKRKNIRAERRKVVEAGVRFRQISGHEASEADWHFFKRCYDNTYAMHGSSPYLNLDFFKRVAASMPDRLMLKLARIGTEHIAVAVFFVGDDALFGRYCGAGGNYHSLHFETCYYQGIEYCIEKKLRRFDPGTQGEHKVPRGFVPTLMSSAHYVVDHRFAAAIRDFAAREARGVDTYAAAVNEHVPYHRAPDEELQL